MKAIKVVIEFTLNSQCLLETYEDCEVPEAIEHLLREYGDDALIHTVKAEY